MSQSEVVTAGRLRAGDELVTSEGLLQLREVVLGTDSVQLRSGFERDYYVGPSRWWAVPTTCRFRRVLKSRRIDMRPDLRAQGTSLAETGSDT